MRRCPVRPYAIAATTAAICLASAGALTAQALLSEARLSLLPARTARQLAWERLPENEQEL
jgi:hypothetical protein